MSERRIYYFDNNATTRVAPEVIEAMLPFLEEQWGNPSSAYRFGHEVAGHLDRARAKVAALIGAEPREIVFTSCGTESNNTALQGILLAHPERRHVVTTAVEHSANLRFCDALVRRGYEVTLVPVDGDGLVDLNRFEQALRPDTAIASVMWANNETGVLSPIAEAAAICRSKGVVFHTDAVQAAGKIPINVREIEIDLLSLSGHKLNAPKGIGALYVKRRTRLQPYLLGGHQEAGRRAGTENVPYIVGFGRAAEMALERLPGHAARLRAQRDQLEAAILGGIPGTARNGAREPRLPNTSNVAFAGLDAEAILMLLDQAGICASSGSACTTGSLEPSHVLTAMGIPTRRAQGSIRFSLGTYTTAEDVEYLIQELPRIIGRLRAAAPPMN